MNKDYSYLIGQNPKNYPFMGIERAWLALYDTLTLNAAGTASKEEIIIDTNRRIAETIVYREKHPWGSSPGF